MPLEVTYASTPQSKLQAWAESVLLAAGIDTPVIQEYSGVEILKTRYILVSVDTPGPHPAFPSGQVWAPLQAVLTLAVTQPRDKINDDSENLREFDRIGRSLDDVFFAEGVKETPGFVIVQWISHDMSGADDMGTNSPGTRTRTWASRFTITFVEKPEP